MFKKFSKYIKYITINNKIQKIDAKLWVQMHLLKKRYKII